MKYTRLITVLLVIAMVLSCKENKTETQEVTKSEQQKVINKKLASADFKSSIENKSVQLIDVRTPEEFSEGHLINANNIDFYESDFLTQMNKLDKNKPVYIYCRSGGRSGKTAVQLKKQGFTEVYDLEGGILEWMENNFEVQENE